MARQRPGTANGIVFVLLEDEYGTINLIVPAAGLRAQPADVRTEPLMLVEGKLERFAAAGGAINVLVDRVGSIAAPDRMLAEVKDFSMLDEQVRRGTRGAAGRPAQDGGRGLPRRRAAGDELCVGKATLAPWAVSSPPVERPRPASIAPSGGSRAIRCAPGASSSSLHRVLGRRRSGRLLCRDPWLVARRARSPPQSLARRPPVRRRSVRRDLRRRRDRRPARVPDRQPRQRE